MRSSGSILAVLSVLVLASCAPATNVPALAPVTALPKPSLPPWILSISPTAQAQTLAQIRVIFAKPILPLQALSGNGAADALDRLHVDPALKGHFVVLTPRMIGFVADQALPVGTRVRITLGAGLHDLAGDRLDNDLAWTFETQALRLRGLPSTTATDDEATPAPLGLTPTLTVTANAALDVASLEAHARLRAGSESIAVHVTPETQPTPPPGSNAAELFDPSLDTWIYDLRPAQQLARATTYTLAIDPGVAPAYGNIPTGRTFAGALRTYGPLGIVPTPAPSPDSGGGRFAGGDPVIAFTNQLDPKSVAGAVTISPSPAAVKAMTFVADQSNTIAIDPYALDPNASYRVTIAPTVKDVFGQSLGEPRTLTITTSDFAPGVWAPTGTNVIPAGVPVAIDFYATNLPGNVYQAAYAPVAPVSLLGGADPLTLLPDPTTWPSRTLAGAHRNVQSVVRVPLQQEIGGSHGALAYGFRTSLDTPDSTPSYTGIAQLTNLGVFAQWFPAHGIVLVQHLSDGAPVGGANVTVYRLDPDNKAAPQSCATGATGRDGELDLYGVDVERCSVGAPANQAPTLGFVVRDGGDVATVTTWSWSGVARFDVNSGWASGAPLSRGTIFSDRQMYQPGERAEITGIAYYVAGNHVVADRNATYRVSLIDPNNASSSLGAVKTDAFGVFSMPIAFSKQQALGYYTVDAKGRNGNDITGSLRIAEFKPPNFKLDLTLSSASAVAGGSVHAGVAGAYLFGAPLQGGTAHAYVTRDLATVQPKGWDDFSFGPQWFWPEQTPSFDTDVLQRDLPLDANGAASLDVGVPADLPFPMTYRVDVETSDVSHLSVADSKSFLALPSDAVIGLSSDVVGKGGVAMPVRVIVTDADGKAVAGRDVHLQLQKMTYTSATQAVEGGESAQQAVKYDTVSTADAHSGDTPVTVQLTPTDAGPYRILATFAGAGSDAGATEIQVFAFGAGEADWGGDDPNAVQVKLDKPQYAIGDTATALIASPFARADIYLAVVRADAIYRTTLRNVSGAARVTFAVTPEMLPNAALEAVVVRRPAPGEHPADTLARTGMAAFTVDLAERYLKLAIAPQNGTVAPGGAQHVAFTVTQKNGAPAPGEIVALVVNDAILQLSGYRLPDLVQTVFAAQPISTIFSDNRENVTLKTPTAPLEKGFGYGGGYLAGAASTRVRENFQPMAYYGVLKTDASGHSQAAFTMPDDLTTWRVMAVALAKDDAHFAAGDATFISSQPLATNPLLPQFARSGDAFDLGLSVANQTGAAGALDLVLRLTGALGFASGDPHASNVTKNAATGMQAFRFPVVAGTPAPTTFEANSALGSQRDAFRVPFLVTQQAITDSVIESGVATTGSSNVPIDFAAGGTLHVTLANSIVPQLAVPAERVIGGDALPLADEAASRLVIASALNVLRPTYKLQLSFAPATEAAANLQRLLALQRADGGFGEFINASQSDPFVSAAALDALLFARARGVAIPAAPVARATAFLGAVLADPGRYKWCAKDALCKAQVRFEALWALSLNGAPRTDFLPQIVAQSNQFDDATQIRVARYLQRTGAWRAQGAQMADRLVQTLYVTGRYATLNLSAPSPWAWQDSRPDAQAQMLQLLLDRHAPAEQIDGAVRALLAQACRCGWPTTDDTASALVALTAYAATEHLVPSHASVTIGGTTVATARFGSTVASQTFDVPVAALRGNAAIVGTTAGRVHYVLLYTYPVRSDAPGELAAFRVMRLVNDPSAAANAAPVATMDLAAGGPVNLPAGRVFDVGVRVIVDHPVDRIVIDDPLPAGFEAVDTTFRTTLQALAPQTDSWQIDAQQIYRDRVIAYASHLGPGVYDVHYLVRSVTPGTFAWPGARAYLQDAPEQFGRSTASTLRVTP